MLQFTASDPVKSNIVVPGEGLQASFTTDQGIIVGEGRFAIFLQADAAFGVSSLLSLVQMSNSVSIWTMPAGAFKWPKFVG
jgi:hypothetical protein